MFPTGVQFNPGEQNIDMYKARQTRNIKDTVIILRALATHNPFSLDTGKNLRNIMNGVNIDSSVMLTHPGVPGIHRLLIQTKCQGSHYGIEVLRKHWHYDQVHLSLTEILF